MSHVGFLNSTTKGYNVILNTDEVHCKTKEWFSNTPKVAEVSPHLNSSN